ncbi:hypothetical protein FIU94_11800 [Sulfitobacter sp. THAF37]|uniref:hypothetical protein n=1 Tax=Sulfitobacter sp. THAF37 TaxID=2587855 RepID=UPI0012689894|nr:hypothetical protein [Sulfitobacter sp. THAF37]QFT59507.1 hypothetical protein FIU94_11800 [Sulfitobacter sp. THAF37]
MALKSNFEGLDFWRLADELSVIDAAFLTLMLEPGDFELLSPNSPMASQIRQNSGWGKYDNTERVDLEEGIGIAASEFRAVFKAIRSAILSDKLPARVVNLGRSPGYSWYGDMYLPIPGDESERTLYYSYTFYSGRTSIFSNSDSVLTDKDTDEERKIYIVKEPDWHQTTVELDALCAWFKSRGVAPLFFFPEGIPDGFRDKDHARYSAKLATAVAAWETIPRPAKNKSVKQTLTDWIISNGVRFGLGNEDGTVSATVAEEVAKIANWNTSGGATPTYTELDDTKGSANAEVRNFAEVPQPERHEYASGSAPRRDLDDDIPF